MGDRLAPLDALAEQERAIERALLPDGSIEEKLARARTLQLGARWQAILDGYLELPTTSNAGREATKRALFLVWYAWVEPAFLTGMTDAFTPDSVRRAISRADELAASAPQDSEFRAMVRWYAEVEPAVFATHEGFTRLRALRRELAGEAPQLPARSPDAWESAGAMGAYWASVSRVA